MAQTPGENLGDAAEDLILLTESARDFAMLVTDTDRRIVRWNPGAENLMGWTEAEIVGRTADEIFTPEDRAADVPAQESATALRDGRAEDERWHMRKDGSRFWASGVMTSLYEPDTGNLRGFGKVMRDLTERKRWEDELSQANAELTQRVAERTAAIRDLARRALAAGEDERRRVSRELHDQTGQQLTAILLELNNIETAAQTIRAAARVAQAASSAAYEASQAAATAAEVAARDDAAPESAGLARDAAQAARDAAITGADAAMAASAAMDTVDKAAPQIAAVRQLVESLARDIHRIAVALRPTSLDDLGLVPALQVLVEECARRTGTRFDFHAGSLKSKDSTGRLPAELETALYRIVQEALTNVARHARGATRISVTLQRIDGNIQAIVEDDGPGFDPEAAGAGRLGLMGMRERAELLEGTVEIESSPGVGTTVFARLPVPQ